MGMLKRVFGGWISFICFSMYRAGIVLHNQCYNEFPVYYDYEKIMNVILLSSCQSLERVPEMTFYSSSAPHEVKLSWKLNSSLCVIRWDGHMFRECNFKLPWLLLCSFRDYPNPHLYLSRSMILDPPTAFQSFVVISHFTQERSLAWSFKKLDLHYTCWINQINFHAIWRIV